ncbi:MAG: SOS response-associated peptidase [Woeseia sp.]
MCGRFAFYSPAEAAAALFGFDAAFPTVPRYNIAPTQLVPVVRDAGAQGREFVMLRWGLVPFRAKDPSIGNRMINARAETLAEKPVFRDAYRNRRCIILADGFYEWRSETRGKTPYFISLASGDPFAFAGLWEQWTNRDTGELLQTTTIVTTAANEFLANLHDRMPVVLQTDTASAWLAGEPGVLDAVSANPPEFQAWPVDRKVNDAKNEGSELIQRAMR